MKNITNTNGTDNTNGITAVLSADGKYLVVSLPLILDQGKKTKNGRNYVAASSGDFPKNWVTLVVDGEEIGFNAIALVKDPTHPDNQPKVEPVKPAMPKFFQKKASSGKVQGNGTVNRLKPASVQ
jgi:hypothetical protein